MHLEMQKTGELESQVKTVLYTSQKLYAKQINNKMGKRKERHKSINEYFKAEYHKQNSKLQQQIYS